MCIRDSCTTGDRYNANCDCEGTLVDTDGDGICDALDQDEESPQMDGNEEDCRVIMRDDFESGPGEWEDGGADADRIQNPEMSNTGVFVFRLRDNTVDKSAIECTTPVLSGELSISFSCIAQSMEPGEDLLLEVDKGSGYELVKDWVSGEDFTNLVRFDDEVTLSNLQNESINLRFRCDASSNADLIFLDDIVIQHCLTGNAQCDANSPCDDNDPCTVGDTYDSACNCVPGAYLDADDDGYCAAMDSDDFDPCIPDDTGCETPCANSWFSEFEESLSQWNLGGTDATVVESHHIPSFGSRAIQLRDNSAHRSSIHTDPMDLNSASDLIIEFDFQATRFATGHDFMLELTNNGGGSYYRIETWTLGDDFVNDVTQRASVAAPKFLLNNRTVIRLRCDASTDANQVIIDNIRVSQCESDLKDDQADRRELGPAPQDELYYTLVPNPASDVLNVITNDNNATLHLYDMNGSKLQAIKPNQDNDISQLKEGVYLIHIRSNGRQHVERFLKL